MKYIVALLLCWGITLVAFGQTEVRLIHSFTRLFNEGKYDSIGNCFSAQAKLAMPVDKTRAFLNQVSSRFGKIKLATFERHENGFGVFKLQMDKGELLLSLAWNPSEELTGMYAKPYQAVVSKMPRNLTSMSLPFKGQWYIFWGGDTQAQNYHVTTNFQKNAFDLVINGPDGKSFKTDGKANEDYYAFGQEICSPCDGEVVLAVDGVKDNVPGKMNKMFVPGNTVMIKTANQEYAFLAHFKQNTIQVRAGDKVKKGQYLGLCGNSGNSSEPHLHFHLQDDDDFEKAVGIKCHFEKIKVNGTAKSNYSPIKGDQVSP